MSYIVDFPYHYLFCILVASCNSFMNGLNLAKTVYWTDKEEDGRISFSLTFFQI